MQPAKVAVARPAESPGSVGNRGGAVERDGLVVAGLLLGELTSLAPSPTAIVSIAIPLSIEIALIAWTFMFILHLSVVL